MPDISRSVSKQGNFIDFSDEWPSDSNYRKAPWNKGVEFSRNGQGGVGIDAYKTVDLDRDNYPKDEYISVELSREETKELIKYLQETIGDDE